VVPTIADLLDTELWWRHDGESVFSAAARERDTLSMPRRDFSRVVSLSGDEFEERRRRLRRWRAAKFGTGALSQLVFGDPWASAYRIGPHRELLGRAAPAASTAATTRVQLENADLLADVDPAAELVPTRVTGRLRDGDPKATRDVAVAVNGRIRAVGRSFHLRGRRAEFFSLLVPESALRPGRNDIRLLEVGAGGELRPL
jgi:hypothetical protein